MVLAVVGWAGQKKEDLLFDQLTYEQFKVNTSFLPLVLSPLFCSLQIFLSHDVRACCIIHLTSACSTLFSFVLHNRK